MTLFLADKCRRLETENARLKLQLERAKEALRMAEARLTELLGESGIERREG